MELFVEQIVDVPVPQILEEISVVVRLTSATARIVDVPIPQIMEEMVEVALLNK